MKDSKFTSMGSTNVLLSFIVPVISTKETIYFLVFKHFGYNISDNPLAYFGMKITFHLS